MLVLVLLCDPGQIIALSESGSSPYHEGLCPKRTDQPLPTGLAQENNSEEVGLCRIRWEGRTE